MNLDSAAILTLVGMACALLGWLLPSPRDKEKMAQTVREDSLRAWTDRIANVEREHRQLEREYIKSNAELSSAVQTLNSNLATLNVTIKELTRFMGQPNGH